MVVDKRGGFAPPEVQITAIASPMKATGGRFGISPVHRRLNISLAVFGDVRTGISFLEVQILTFLWSFEA